MTPPAAMRDTLATIEGLVTDEVADALAELAGNVDQGEAIVEVGSYHGKSTAYLAAHSRPDVPVYAVDPWELVTVTDWCGWCPQPTRSLFERNLARVGLLWKVLVRQGRSTDVARAYDGPPIGLLFVDGDHSAEALAADIHAWRPHLSDGAVIAVDDYGVTTNPDVGPVVDELVDAGDLEWVELTGDGRLAVLRETSR
jgi:predicted O-methyltransferase YrrM